MQMGPMIDMVFLLLVFFIVTSKPIQPESDINLGLPGTVAQTDVVEMPDEQRLEIMADGRIVLNEMELAAGNDGDGASALAYGQISSDLDGGRPNRCQ